MLRGGIGTVVCDDHDGRSRGPARPIGASAAVAVRPSTPLPGPWRRRLSKSVAKARIAPEHRRRIVDIPRFSPPPIPARGAFATDLDKPPPEAAPRAPHAPPRSAEPVQQAAAIPPVHCRRHSPGSAGRRGPRLPGRRTHRLRGSGLQGAEVRKVHPHSSLHSHYYQQHRHRRTVALYCHGPVVRQGVRSREKVAPAYF